MTISPQQPVSSRTSRMAACSLVSRASTCPLGKVQTRGSPRPINSASYPDSRARSVKPPAETSYLIRISSPIGDGKGRPRDALHYSHYSRRDQEGRPEEAPPLFLDGGFGNRGWVNGEEALAAARAAGLRYVSDQMPGIGRRKHGDAFEYVGTDGRRVTDEADLDRIRSLAVPPAYADVWICPSRNGHIQATGRDARGRK